MTAEGPLITSVAQIEGLIKSVEKNPILYDSQLPEFKDHFLKDLLWEEIATELHFTCGDSAKTKWKNIRDSYTKYLKYYNSNKSDKYKKYKNWPWASHLEFLNLRETKPPKVEYVCEEDYAEPLELDEEQERRIKRMCIARSQSTVDRILNHLERTSMHRHHMDATDLLFSSYAQTLKTFTIRRQATIKMQIAQIMAEAEVEETSQFEPVIKIESDVDLE